ncbi:hypothetical protein MSAN_01829100 [Mycena sanguinolenta]|uniref:Uncharacterized protein n=1 Tax=Mycena sanguinolenta TaxID=230812 RepID=A0A8H7CS10_9AGAR|nr:hypothetical protein MSAN_01829100 [Mycena sanguinolenta]
MATQRFPPNTNRMPEASAKDASQTLTRTDHEQASLHVPSTPSGSLAGGPGANRRRRYNHPSSNEDLSTPSSVPNARKRHRNRPRHNASSQVSVAGTGNTEAEDANQRDRTQMNVDNDRARPAKRARKGASTLTLDDRTAVRNQSTANTRFNRRQNPGHAAAGLRREASTRFAGSGGSQVGVNATRHMESPHPFVSGGMGGAGGSGGLIGGPGENGAGTVVNFVFNFPR